VAKALFFYGLPTKLVVVFFEKIVSGSAPIKGGLRHALNSAKNAQLALE